MFDSEIESPAIGIVSPHFAFLLVPVTHFLNGPDEAEITIKLAVLHSSSLQFAMSSMR